jgi:hypothetical protein
MCEGVQGCIKRLSSVRPGAQSAATLEDIASMETRRVQLVYSGDTNRIASGSRIRVTGKLFQAHARHYRTNVLIEVSEPLVRQNFLPALKTQPF